MVANFWSDILWRSWNLINHRLSLYGCRKIVSIDLFYPLHLCYLSVTRCIETYLGHINPYRESGVPAVQFSLRPLVRAEARIVGNRRSRSISLLLVTWFRVSPVYQRPWYWPCMINSLAPVRSECDSRNVIFNLVLQICIFRSSHDNALWWMPQNLTDDKSTLVQVMAWCRQATSHYLSQCWLSSLSPYGVASPKWVKESLYVMRDDLNNLQQLRLEQICVFSHSLSRTYRLHMI